MKKLLLTISIVLLLFACGESGFFGTPKNMIDNK
jgi:hypothetical protein